MVVESLMPPVETLGSVREVRYNTFIYLTILRFVELMDPEELTVFLRFQDDKVSQRTFRRAWEGFRRIFPVLEQLQFSGPRTHSWSQEVSDIMYDLRHSVVMTSHGEINGVIFGKKQKAYLDAALNKLFGSDKHLRAAFDEFALYLTRLVAASPITGRLPPNIGRRLGE